MADGKVALENVIDFLTQNFSVTGAEDTMKTKITECVSKGNKMFFIQL